MVSTLSVLEVVDCPGCRVAWVSEGPAARPRLGVARRGAVALPPDRVDI